MHRYSLIPAFFLPFLDIESAFAHWGHVGEFAGHGHVIAVGALAAAAALAAALRGSKQEDEDTEEEGETSAEPKGEAV